MIKFFKKILTKIGYSENQNNDFITLYIEDHDCGNIIEVRAIKTYDLHRIYEDELPGNYRLKKVVICDDCYNKVYIEVCFDEKYDIVFSEADGGEIFQEMEEKR